MEILRVGLGCVGKVGGIHRVICGRWGCSARILCGDRRGNRSPATAFFGFFVNSTFIRWVLMNPNSNPNINLLDSLILKEK